MSDGMPAPETASSVQQLVVSIVRSLCDQPDSVALDTDSSSGDLALHVEVADEDFERVLGRGGRTARSLRTIAGAAAAKSGSRCTLDIRSVE